MLSNVILSEKRVSLFPGHASQFMAMCMPNPITRTRRGPEISAAEEDLEAFVSYVGVTNSGDPSWTEGKCYDAGGVEPWAHSKQRNILMKTKLHVDIRCNIESLKGYMLNVHPVVMMTRSNSAMSEMEHDDSCTSSNEDSCQEGEGSDDPVRMWTPGDSRIPNAESSQNLLPQTLNKLPAAATLALGCIIRTGDEVARKAVEQQYSDVLSALILRIGSCHGTASLDMQPLRDAIPTFRVGDEEMSQVLLRDGEHRISGDRWTEAIEEITTCSAKSRLQEVNNICTIIWPALKRLPARCCCRSPV